MLGVVGQTQDGALGREAGRYGKATMTAFAGALCMGSDVGVGSLYLLVDLRYPPRVSGTSQEPAPGHPHP